MKVMLFFSIILKKYSTNKNHSYETKIHFSVNNIIFSAVVMLYICVCFLFGVFFWGGGLFLFSLFFFCFFFAFFCCFLVFCFVFCFLLLFVCLFWFVFLLFFWFFASFFLCVRRMVIFFLILFFFCKLFYSEGPFN